MANDLVEAAKERGLKYFLISFVDLFGVMRAKLVPASAIDTVARSGAGFAGVAAWFDMTPADPDVLATPEPDSLVKLPWKPEVAWVASDLVMGGKDVAQSPRQILKRMVAAARAQDYELKTGVECEYFLIMPDGSAISDAADRQAKPARRPRDVYCFFDNTDEKLRAPADAQTLMKKISGAASPLRRRI